MLGIFISKVRYMISYTWAMVRWRVGDSMGRYRQTTLPYGQTLASWSMGHQLWPASSQPQLLVDPSTNLPLSRIGQAP